MGEVDDSGNSTRASDHYRCHYLVRMKDDEGRPAWDDDGTPLLRRCRQRIARQEPAGDPGVDLCKFHLSDSYSQQAILEGQVGQLLRDLDIGPVANPIDGLLEAMRHAGSMMRLLRLMVGRLDTEPVFDTDHLISPATGDMQTVVKPGGIWGWDKDGEQAPNVVVSLYGTWLERYAKIAKMCSDAGLDERIVRNAEATTGGLFIALTRALERMELEPGQQAELRRFLGEELRAVEGMVIDVPAIG